MDIQAKPWNLVVDKGGKMLLSLEVNSVARFPAWAEVVDVQENEFTVKTSAILPSYYDAKFFFIPSAGVMYFGKGGVYISPDGMATVYPEGDFIYAEDIFSDPSNIKPFAIPVECKNITMSMIYIDPEDDGSATVRILVPVPTYIKRGFCSGRLKLPLEYTIKEIETTIDVLFATEVVYGRNHGIGILGRLQLDSPDLYLISSAFVPPASK